MRQYVLRYSSSYVGNIPESTRLGASSVVWNLSMFSDPRMRVQSNGDSVRWKADICSERSPQLPLGWFGWIKAFYKIPDVTALNHSSIDGFLFLRYLKVVCIICGVGCLIIWPVLIPLHILGGGGDKQLDLLTFGNVDHPKWYFVHACIAWIYFGRIGFCYRSPTLT
jgi:hypothetical protein